MINGEIGLLSGIDYEHSLSRYRGERVARMTEMITGERLSLPLWFYIDMYYIHYLPAPLIKPGRDNNTWRRVVDSLLSSNYGQRIRSKTILDSFMSTLSASIMISRLIEKNIIPLKENSKEENSSMKASNEDIDKVISETSEDVENIYNLRMIAEGLQPGSLSVVEYEKYSMDLLKLARKVDVKKLIEMLKGIKNSDIIGHRRYRWARRGMKVGYTLGSDLERVSTRSLILDEDLFYFKLAEGRLLLYVKAYEKSTGPVYLLIDKSGSMEGDKITWAKALALSIYMRSIREGRELFVRFFDSQPHKMIHVRGKPGSREAIGLIEYIAKMKNTGGTDITRALVTALSDIKRVGVKECSITLITDGIDRVSEPPVRRGLIETQSKLYTVMIKGDNESLRSISDGYFQAVKLRKDEMIRVLKAIG